MVLSHEYYNIIKKGDYNGVKKLYKSSREVNGFFRGYCGCFQWINDLNEDYNYSTPLIVAILHEKYEIAAYLLGIGANANATNALGKRASDYLLNSVNCQFHNILKSYELKNALESKGIIDRVKKSQEEARLNSDLKEQNNSSYCCICLDERKCIVFLPCNHLCICENCSVNHKVKKCPLCREKVDKNLKVFL